MSEFSPLEALQSEVSWLYTAQWPTNAEHPFKTSLVLKESRDGVL